jgi:ABC-type polysaccharide/polyol phosphate transport system ATPase subunit
MSVVLRVEGVSKQYRIYRRPGDRLVEYLTRGRARRHSPFWALRDVSFEVESGTTVGVLGPNGCGKSTLLRIVAGTLEPTRGATRHEGRVAALLELGAGFDDEFTGLENVFMNASLMGFSRAETRERLPRILRFAEIGDFINRPVKTYSSGMYVRLAFAIAVSVDPQVLLVDEALSVGDAAFQHRCLRRIREMQERGATILFVSHDTAAVRALCTRAILLNAGRVVADGSPSDVLKRYQKIVMAREESYEEAERGAAGSCPHAAEGLSGGGEEDRAPLSYAYRHGDESAEIVRAELTDARREPARAVETGGGLSVRLRVRFSRDADDPVFGFLIRDRHGVHAYGTNTKEQRFGFGRVRAGESVEVSFSFACWLAPGPYSISAAVHSRDGASLDWMDGVIFFDVTSPALVEGIANLNARVEGRRLGAHAPHAGLAAGIENAGAITG